MSRGSRANSLAAWLSLDTQWHPVVLQAIRDLQPCTVEDVLTHLQGHHLVQRAGATANNTVQPAFTKLHQAGIILEEQLERTTRRGNICSSFRVNPEAIRDEDAFKPFLIAYHKIDKKHDVHIAKLWKALTGHRLLPAEMPRSRRLQALALLPVFADMMGVTE